MLKLATPSARGQGEKRVSQMEAERSMQIRLRDRLIGLMVGLSTMHRQEFRLLAGTPPSLPL
jgi:hypothetical protein